MLKLHIIYDSLFPNCEQEIYFQQEKYFPSHHEHLLYFKKEHELKKKHIFTMYQWYDCFCAPQRYL